MDPADIALIEEAVAHMESCVLAIMRLADAAESAALASALLSVGDRIEQMQSELEAL